MFSKTHKQRAISELDSERQVFKYDLNLKVIEARLTTNISRLGPMSPYVKIQSDKEQWRSESSSGMHPKWNEVYLFSPKSPILEVSIHDKGLFSDSEIGRCQIHLSDVLQGHLTEWWSLVSSKLDLTGEILLSFEFSDPEPSFTHSSSSSWDLRSHHLSDSSPVFKRINKFHSMQISNLTPESQKIVNFNTEPDEEIKLEQLRFELIEEDERLKVQETKVRLFFEKVKLENDKINKERRQVERETEELRKREQIMLEAREGLQEEKEGLQKEWIDVEKMRNGLNLNFALLKMEKIRIRAKRKVVEREKNRVFKNLKGIWDKRERGNEFCFEKGYDGDRD
jgi:hypothetical protein